MMIRDYNIRLSRAVGTTPYHSPLTDKEEHLPAAIGVLSAKGSDIMLTDLMSRMMEGLDAQDAVKEPHNGVFQRLVNGVQQRLSKQDDEKRTETSM